MGPRFTRSSRNAGRPVTPDELRACMREHPDARVVVLSHCETATGVVNDLEQLAGVVAEQNGLLIIDAVSSFGAVRTAVDAWGVGICCTASQKALEAPPGLAPVIVNPAAWEFLDSQAPLHHGMYSDLRTWRDYAAKWADFHPHPATMAVNIMYALQVSTDGLLAEGLAARYARFERVGQHVRERLRSLGLSPAGGRSVGLPDHHGGPTSGRGWTRTPWSPRCWSAPTRASAAAWAISRDKCSGSGTWASRRPMRTWTPCSTSWRSWCKRRWQAHAIDTPQIAPVSSARRC